MCGGFKLHAEVLYVGPEREAPTGECWNPGTSGKVVGPSTSEAYKGKGINVKFPYNNRNVACFYTELEASQV